jgi:hypothetical protein
MTNFELMRDRLERRAGLLPPPSARYDFATLQKTEWSPTFEQYMRNRLIMGAMRYEPLIVKKSKPGRWDLIGAVKKKMERYEETGNTEYLVDIANYCMLAFECDDHPNKHFHALDDHHEHCEIKKVSDRIMGPAPRGRICATEAANIARIKADHNQDRDVTDAVHIARIKAVFNQGYTNPCNHDQGGC